MNCLIVPIKLFIVTCLGGVEGAIDGPPGQIVALAPRQVADSARERSLRNTQNTHIPRLNITIREIFEQVVPLIYILEGQTELVWGRDTLHGHRKAQEGDQPRKPPK